jgi:nitrogen fixation-related uncharacterized protein
MDIKKITEKITLPVSIVIAAVILGIVFYAIQYNKQQSIERQQLFEQQEERIQKDLENKRAELKLKQDECNSLSSGVKERWNNVVGVTYDSELWKECVVTYTDTKTGEIVTSPLRLMQDVK